MTSTKKISYGITGGIGSGKSYVCRIIKDIGYPVFCCDTTAKHIIRTDEHVRQALTRIVGEGVYDEAGRLVKSRLAAFLCSSPDNADRVNQIVWPLVAEAFVQWEKAQTERIVFMECALLFESGFHRLTTRTIHVAAPRETRIRRVMERDKVSRATALRWIKMQMPEREKRRRADHIIHNDGQTALMPQLLQLLQ